MLDANAMTDAELAQWLREWIDNDSAMLEYHEEERFQEIITRLDRTETNA